MSLPITINSFANIPIVTSIAAAVWGAYSWLLPPRHHTHETSSAYGEARWATHREIKKTGHFGDTGIVVGRSRGRLLRNDSDRHLLTIAPSRAGKGVSAIIPNLLTWSGSMIVIDPKGENAVVTARQRAAMGQRVHVLDPWGITGLAPSHFNPLLELSPDDDDLAEDAALLSESLVVGAAKQEDEFWHNEARSLIAGLIMHIVTTETRQHCHLGTLRRFLTLGDKHFSELLADMLRNHAAHGLVQRAAQRFLQKTDREASGVISTAQSQTHFLDSPRMSKVLGHSDFRLSDLKSKKTTIYLVLPTERLSTHGRWLRLIISLYISALTRDRRAPDTPVLFLLDEFAALGRLQAIETALGLLAGYGVLLWPILQDIAQLQDLYPKRWRSFLANAGMVQAFGVNDIGSAEFLSKVLGQRTVIVRQHGRGGDKQRQQASENYSAVARPLLMPQEIMRLRRGHQIILMNGERPILCDRLRYYNDADFTGLFDANPMLQR